MFDDETLAGTKSCPKRSRLRQWRRIRFDTLWTRQTFPSAARFWLPDCPALADKRMTIYDTFDHRRRIPAAAPPRLYLARAGKKVLLLEKEHFPRFHIGESLLPYNLQIFRELDLMPALREAGFMRKFGAQFHLGNGKKGTKFIFHRGHFTREAEAIQVERSRFDHVLLKHARASGADVREGWTVGKFTQTRRHRRPPSKPAMTPARLKLLPALFWSMPADAATSPATRKASALSIPD